MKNDNLDLSVRGMTVQSIYTDYLNGKFNVNRKYQRKLVWREREKAYLIDSILRNLPIPLVLLAKGKSGAYEIVDGLQRVNAIVEFLENKYPVNGKYFDLERLGDTKDLKSQGVLTQMTPTLGSEECRRIFNYEVPVSVYSNQSQKEVEEVFRRINSSGQHLSRQDIRQAGAVSEISSLVRQISSEIRGDISTDEIIPLGKMAEISLTDQSDSDTGLQVADVYWVSNGILDEDSIRTSRDEELVLDILLDMLSDSIVPSDSGKRDEAYGIGRKEEDSALDRYESKIRTIGAKQLMSDFFTTFDAIRAISDKADKSWTSLTKPGTNSKRKGRYFQLLFFPIYELLVREQRIIASHDGLMEELTDFWEKAKIDVPKGGGTLSRTDKERIFTAIKGRLDKWFGAGNPEEAARVNARMREFEGDLVRNLIETSRFEIKIGISDLKTRKINTKLLARLPKIASAIANSHPFEQGVLYIGVSDDPEYANAVGGGVPFRNYYCCGIDHDLDALGIDKEEYYRKIKGEFRKHSKEDSRFADFEVDLFDYHGRSVISIRTPQLSEPIWFNDDLYYREDSDTKMVGGGKENFEFFKRFQQARAGS